MIEYTGPQIESGHTEHGMHSQATVCPFDGVQTENGLTVISACDRHWDNPEAHISQLREAVEALRDIWPYVEHEADVAPDETRQRVERALAQMRLDEFTPATGAAVFVLLKHAPDYVRGLDNIPYVMMEWRNHSGPQDVLRKFGPLAPYRWVFVGGKLEPGESAVQALRREAREELGIVVRAHEALSDGSPLYADGHEGDDAWRAHPFVITAYEGDVELRKTTDSDDNLNWRRLSEAQQSGSPSTKRIADMVAHLLTTR